LGWGDAAKEQEEARNAMEAIHLRRGL
jgi:hypothetical protein